MASTPDKSAAGADQVSTEPAWCAVANVVRLRPFGPGGAELRAGTKHFSPGTKVYVRGVFWGMGGEDVEVIGRHRGTRRLVAMVIRSAWLMNWRVKLVYEPRVLSLLRAAPNVGPWDGSHASRARAEEIARALGRVAAGVPGAPSPESSARTGSHGLVRTILGWLRGLLPGRR